jgi:hypothetical protein
MRCDSTASKMMDWDRMEGKETVDAWHVSWRFSEKWVG